MTSVSRIARWMSAVAGTAVFLTIPAVGLAQSTDDQTTTPAARTDAVTPAGAPGASPVDVPAPSFLRPQLTLLPGVGWEVDTGGPGIKIERFRDDK